MRFAPQIRAGLPPTKRKMQLFAFGFWLQFPKVSFAPTGTIGWDNLNLTAKGLPQLLGCEIIQKAVFFVPEHHFGNTKNIAAQIALALLDDIPLLALLTDNVPLYQGESNHNYSIHTHIWNNVDPDRCGIYPNVMDSNFGFESYAAYILQQPLVVARHGARIVGVGRKSAFEVYPSFLGHGDIEQILSMFYYDVCLNHNGIELRTADSLAPRYAASYAQLIKTLFSSHAAQEGILRRYAGANSAQIEAAKVGICCNGYQAQVYGRAAAGEVSWLLAQAKSHAAAPDDRRLLEPLAELAAKKRTPREISGCV